MKDYIVECKEKRLNMRSCHLEQRDEEKLKKEKKEVEELNRSMQTTEFLLVEIDRLIKEHSGEVTQKLESLGEVEILNLQSRIPVIQSSINGVSLKLQKLLSVIPDSYPNKSRNILKITASYNNLLDKHIEFKDNLQKEIDTRELKKEKSFDVSKLKIEIQKFKGYESKIDIYTFKEKFEKLCVKTTPKRLLPELLKNNYLEGPALDHVKKKV